MEFQFQFEWWKKPVIIHGMMPYYLLYSIAGFFWECIPFPGYRYRWKKSVIIPGMMPYYLLSSIAGLVSRFRDTSTMWQNGIHVSGQCSMRIHVKWQYGSANLKHFSLVSIAKRWRQNFHFPRHVVLAGFLRRKQFLILRSIFRVRTNEMFVTWISFGGNVQSFWDLTEVFSQSWYKVRTCDLINPTFKISLFLFQLFCPRPWHTHNQFLIKTLLSEQNKTYNWH